MRVHRLVLACAVALSLPALAGAAPAAASKKYTLKEIEDLIRRANPGIQRAQAKLGEAKAQLLKARLLWLPKATFTAVFATVPRYRCVVPESFRNVAMTDGSNLYDRMNAVREDFCLGTNASDTVGDFFSEFTRLGYYVRLGLNIAQPIYTFGKFLYARRLAKTNLQIGKARIQQERIKAIHDARRAYFGIKLAREVLFTIDEGMPYIRRAEKYLKREMKQDKVDMTDLYRLQIMKAEIEDGVLQVKRGERLGIAALSTLVGRRSAKGFDIDPRPLAPIKAEIKPLSHYIDLARKHRPDMALLDLAQSAAATNVKLRRSQFLPDIGLILNYGARFSQAPDDPHSAYLRDELHGSGLYVGLAVRFNLDYHFKYAELAKARATYAATRIARRQAVGGIRLQIERAYSSLVLANKRMKLLKRQKKAAHKWVVTMSQRHSIGTAKTQDLTSALRAEFGAAGKLHQAVHNFNIAAAELSRMVGTDITRRWEKPMRR